MTFPTNLRYSAVVLAVAALVAGCGGGGGSSSEQSSTRPSDPQFRGAVANPAYPAKPLRLRNYNGTPVDLSGYRGKAVLVTFIYDHCPDVCPLIVSHLHTAQAELGGHARKLRIVAVSVDPKGDTPRTVAAFLRSHQMTGRMDYLIGSRPQLESVWKEWGILSKADPKVPDQVEHSALVYGISASGKVMTLYPANFKPAWIVHDVPKLAAL
jgi:protein SCO1